MLSQSPPSSIGYPFFLFDTFNRKGDNLMASTSYILSFEDTNTSSIHLHQDGIFWRAYDRSAYLFVERTACDYKLTKRYVKLADRSLVSLGFPTASLDKYLVDVDFEYINARHICISNLGNTGKPIDIDAYTAWHDSIAFAEPKNPSQYASTPAVSDFVTHVHVYEPAPLDALAIGETGILDRLLSFRTEQSTAIDCLVFLSKLQRDLISLRNKSSP